MKFSKNSLPGSYIVSKAISLNALPPRPSALPTVEPVVKAEPVVDMDSEDDIPLEATYELSQEDLDRLLDETEQEPTVQGVSKALKDIHAKLDALENDDDEDYVVEMEDEDDKEPVEKAAGAVKYIRRFRRGNKWAYVYPQQKGGKTAISAKHLPGEGHKFQVGEAIHTGDTMHRVKSATDTHVTTVDSEGKEHTHAHAELRNKAHKGHADAIEHHKQHGHEQRKAVLESAKKHGHAPTIARAQKELDRFAKEHGVEESLGERMQKHPSTAKINDILSQHGDNKDFKSLLDDKGWGDAEDDAKTAIDNDDEDSAVTAHEKKLNLAKEAHDAYQKHQAKHKAWLSRVNAKIKSIREKMKTDPDAASDMHGDFEYADTGKHYLSDEGLDNGEMYAEAEAVSEAWDKLGDEIDAAKEKFDAEAEAEGSDDPHGLYAALGIEPEASDEEVKAAYKAKAKEHHPDKGGDAETIKKINAAYDVLKDPDLRDKYHETGDLKAVQAHAKSRAKKSLSSDTVLESLDWLIRRGT